MVDVSIIWIILLLTLIITHKDLKKNKSEGIIVLFFLGVTGALSIFLMMDDVLNTYIKWLNYTFGSITKLVTG